MILVLFDLYVGGIKGFHTFPEGISTKVNVIAWLQFELA